ncbi:MAG: glycosyltransferase family 2 protein [Vampirovibrionales bacterium]
MRSPASSTALPLVTVLVPICNVAPYLEACLRSLEGQRYTNLEILLLDDGSTDASPAICQLFTQRDARFRLIQKPNTGYGHTMNVGLSEAKGNYIAILESDDVATPTFIEALVQAAETHQLEAVKGHFYFWSPRQQRQHVCNFSMIPTGQVLQLKPDSNPFFHTPSIWSGVYRRSFLEQHGIRFLETAGASYQDMAFSFKVYTLAKRFMLLAEPLVYYRVDSAISSSNGDTRALSKLFCVCDEYAEIFRFAKAVGVYSQRKDALQRLRFTVFRGNYRRAHPKGKHAFLARWRVEVWPSLLNGDFTPSTYGWWVYLNLWRLMLTPAWLFAWTYPFKP